VLAHRVRGIGPQIHDDLVHLGWVTHHRGAIAVDVGLDVDGRRQRSTEEPQRLLHDWAQADDAALLLAPPAKGENLRNEIARTHAGLESVGQKCTRGMGLRQIELGELQVAEDAREDVVEIVSHATGERPDGLHFLGLAQLKLELLAHLVGLDRGGDVTGDDDTVLLAGRGVETMPGSLEAEQVPVAMPVAVAPAALAADHGLQNRPEIIGVDWLEHVAAEQLGRAVASDRLVIRADVEHDALRIDLHDQIAGIFDEQAETLLALAQQILGVFARGDVLHRHHQPHLPVEFQHAEGDEQRQLGAIFGPRGAFDRVAALLGEGLIEKDLPVGRGAKRAQLDHRVSDDLIEGVAEKVKRRGIDVIDDAVADAGDDDGQRAVVEERREAALARAEPLQILPAGEPALGLAQLAGHRGPEAVELALEQKIVGAAAHGLDDAVFATRIGHEDEGRIEPALPVQRQRSEPAESRHLVIGQKHVPGRILQCEGKRIGRLDAFDCGIVSGPAQLLHQRLRVLGRIFDQKQSQWGE